MFEKIHALHSKMTQKNYREKNVESFTQSHVVS